MFDLLVNPLSLSRIGFPLSGNQMSTTPGMVGVGGDVGEEGYQERGGRGGGLGDVRGWKWPSILSFPPNFDERLPQGITTVQ